MILTIYNDRQPRPDLAVRLIINGEEHVIYREDSKQLLYYKIPTIEYKFKSRKKWITKSIVLKECKDTDIMFSYYHILSRCIWWKKVGTSNSSQIISNPYVSAFKQENIDQLYQMMLPESEKNKDTIVIHHQYSRTTPYEITLNGMNLIVRQYYPIGMLQILLRCNDKDKLGYYDFHFLLSAVSQINVKNRWITIITYGNYLKGYGKGALWIVFLLSIIRSSKRHDFGFYTKIFTVSTS